MLAPNQATKVRTGIWKITGSDGLYLRKNCDGWFISTSTWPHANSKWVAENQKGMDIMGPYKSMDRAYLMYSIIKGRIHDKSTLKCPNCLHELNFSG